jgi:hypothetical protein
MEEDFLEINDSMLFDVMSNKKEGSTLMGHYLPFLLQ